MRRGIVSILDVNKPRLEAGDITGPLRGGNYDLYSFDLDHSANGFAENYLALIAVTNVQVWHRRLGHLNKRSLELVDRKNSNGVALTVIFRTVTSVPWGKAICWLTIKHPTTPPFMHHFSSCTEISWAPSNGRFTGDTSLSATSPTISPSRPQSTFS